MIHMPKGAKALKDLLSHKEKLEKAASSVKLSEECSAIIQRSLPQNEGDPCSFTLPCLIGPLAVKNPLADLRASINLMPHSLFRRLRISKTTKMSIQLADGSIKYPIGVCENLLVKVSKFIFPVDFVVLEMDEDELVPIILGRPFLATKRAMIDVHEGKLSLRVRNETITFNIRNSMKSKHSRDDYLYCADHTAKLVQEQWVNTVNHDGKWTEDEEEEDSNKALAVSFYPRTEPVESLEWKILENRLKPSSMEPPRLELKELSKHLKYAFLQENNQLPVVISSILSTDKKIDFSRFFGIIKGRSLRVLRTLKGSTHPSVLTKSSWKMSSNQVSNLKDELTLTSRSPVQVVPKKGGMTVVKNEKDELIPQRIEFDIEIHNKKGAENLAADHLSRLENPDLGKLTRAEIRDLFPEEQVMAIFDKNNEPWYANYANYLASRVLPFRSTRQEKQKFFSDLRHYFWDDPFLFKQCANRIIQRCVAGEEAAQILRQCHSGPSGGHHGIATTARKVFEAGFYWPHIFRNARKLVQGIDFIGPFPSSNGNKYVMVAIDYVSKWVEAHAFPTNDARNVVNFLKRLFARFGIPKALISDRGTHFYNHQMKKAMKRYGVVHRFLTAYHP
ncbi:reverse transcriptase domain-containing protein [Tanacetum coccineum]